MNEQRFKSFAAMREFYRPLDMEKPMRRAVTLIIEPTPEGWSARALEAPEIGGGFAPLLIDCLLAIAPSLAKWANADPSADATNASLDDMPGTVD